MIYDITNRLIFMISYILLNDNDDEAIIKFIAVIAKCKYNIFLCIGVSSTESDGNANSGVDPIGVFFTINSDVDKDDDNDDSSLDSSDASFNDDDVLIDDFLIHLNLLQLL